MSNELFVDDRPFEEVFPEVEIAQHIKPQGNRVLLQLKKVKSKTRSGFILTDSTKQTERYNEQVAIVRHVGDLAYKHASDLTTWAEGAWCAPGDLVRVAKYGGDRWSISHGEGDDKDWVHFVVVQDREIVCRISDFETAKKIVAFID